MALMVEESRRPRTLFELGLLKRRLTSVSVSVSVSEADRPEPSRPVRAVPSAPGVPPLALLPLPPGFQLSFACAARLRSPGGS